MTKAIINGRILLPDAEVRGKALLFDSRIKGITSQEEAFEQAEEIIDARGMYVSPGLIDTHTHGYAGVEFVDGTPGCIRKAALALPETGVTSFLVTTATDPWDVLEAVFDETAQLMAESCTPAFGGAEILGVHAEGPFINPTRKGAMTEKNIRPFDLERVLPYRDLIRVMTVAPEMPGGLDFIRAIRERTDIRLSMGHTDATFEEAMAGFRAGITRATHLFNAMSPLKHRAPGAVGAALTADVYTELIGDTHHVDAALYPLVIRAKGNKLVLVTDASRYIGMPEGEYEFNGEKYIVEDHLCKLADGTIAGSMLTMNIGVRNLRDYGGIPMYQAARIGSLNAAESCGMAARKGSLEEGKDADIVLMDEECGVYQTYVRGNCKYKCVNE